MFWVRGEIVADRKMWLKQALPIAVGGVVILYAGYQLISSKNLFRGKTKRVQRKNPNFKLQEAMPEKKGAVKRKVGGGMRDVFLDIGWEEGSDSAVIIMYSEPEMKSVVNKVSLARHLLLG